jgi:hypothetical protein
MTKLRRYAVGLSAGLMGLLLAGGCAAPGPSVPASATLMSTGNAQVAFRPAEYGRVYVVDETKHKILYQADVDRAQTVQLDAAKDTISVDGRTVSQPALPEGNEYRIFFEPMSKERVVKYRVTEERVTEPHQ